MNDQILKICEAVRDAGGRAMLVGGYVRDFMLARESNDFDLEVYRIAPERLRSILQNFGPVNVVGESFAVYKVTLNTPALDMTGDQAGPRIEIDVSIPRRESKSGRGHRGFTIVGDPHMSFDEAARRRDFTINAVLLDPLTGEKIDPYGGERDLNSKILRVVSPETFVEDSLRVLRAVQLAARFELTVDPQTVELCRSVDLSDLPRERVWGEIEKLITMARHPSIGLNVARDVKVFDKLFPEMSALVDSEGPFRATARALDAAVPLVSGLTRPKRIAVMLAVLFRTLPIEGVLAVLGRLGVQTVGGVDVRSVVLALLAASSRPQELFDTRAPDGAIRRLSRDVELDLLYRLGRAWAEATESATELGAAECFIERARELGVEHSAPAPILLGRHLLEAGIEPGPAMGEILRQVYELQLDGNILSLEEALAAARRISSSSEPRNQLQK